MDYLNGKIYRIVCSKTNKQYIGSTCSTLTKRLHQHNKKNEAGFGCSCKDFINPKIFLVEDFPCERKEQLLMRERFWMENTDCVNINRPIVTREEHIRENKERYISNREDILAFKNRKLMCECGHELMYQNLSRHRRTPRHISIMNGTD